MITTISPASSYKHRARLIECARSKRKLADEDFAEHARLTVAIVNGILRRLLAHELLIGATAPLSVLWVIRCENNDPCAPRFRELRGDLVRDRANGLLAELGRRAWQSVV